eukprot:CAMPEP_0114254404 /NCGR_PEP_ID=MMETSP0058-20121206/16959_1 /TAXON_ID=36894 /ORGANISM="Pyramimonas parkeae, CCMP726" /LENGTH=238 /DNA_ID=CAMNT_0001368617 /DNA_START=288 /DNA_END=1001 /DNA_ORIENTATION=-
MSKRKERLHEMVVDAQSCVDLANKSVESQQRKPKSDNLEAQAIRIRMLAGMLHRNAQTVSRFLEQSDLFLNDHAEQRLVEAHRERQSKKSQVELSQDQKEEMREQWLGRRMDKLEEVVDEVGRRPQSMVVVSVVFQPIESSAHSSWSGLPPSKNALPKQESLNHLGASSPSNPATSGATGASSSAAPPAHEMSAMEMARHRDTTEAALLHKVLEDIGAQDDATVQRLSSQKGSAGGVG